MDQSLTAYLGDKPADSSVLQLFRRVLKTVNAIHASGASHPPLSPTRIRVRDSGEALIQKLDRPYGLADTVAFGSAKYSAPEAFLGRTESSSCEVVDCYVLGFMFYEILIGRQLFVAQFASLENGPSSLWLKWHADRAVRARPLTQLRPDLGHFARLIDGMIDKDPSRRIGNIPRILSEFSTVEVHTEYNIGQSQRSASPGTAQRFAALAGKKVAATAARVMHLLAEFRASLPDFPKSAGALRKPQVAVAVGVSIALGFIISALVAHRDASPRHTRQQPVASAPPLAQHVKEPARPAVQPAQEQTPAPPTPDLQVESHLQSVAFLLLDDLRRTSISPGGSLTAKLAPGSHKLSLVSRSKFLFKLPANIGPDSDVTLTELSGNESSQNGVQAANVKSFRLAVPSAAITIKIVIEPGDQTPSLIPVEISANVPDSFVLINGVKLTRTLDKGVRIVHLRAGEYRIKLAHAGYEDSAEQNLAINENDSPQKLRFVLSPILHHSILTVSSGRDGVEILIDGKSLGVSHADTEFKAKVSPGRHTVTLRKTDFEDFATTRDFPDGAAVNIGTQGMRPFGRIAFHILPQTAQVNCRREADGEAQDCENNQTSLLRAGAYDVTAKASGFETKTSRIVIGAGEERPLEWKLTVNATQSALTPVSFFENGQNWTIEPSGWWAQTQQGYSFMRANQGTFVFEILKPSGFFASKKVAIVVNYRDEGNRVLYTIDGHSFRRNRRASGVQAGQSVAHEIPDAPNYRLTLELSNDKVTIRNADGQMLDSLDTANTPKGKVGFSGKVKLRIVQARYPQA